MDTVATLVAGFTPYTLDGDFYSHIPQALPTSYVLFGNLCLFISDAMLMRPKKVETAVHG